VNDLLTDRKRAMPLFQCPNCGKQYLVPLALCESFLEGTPTLQPEGGSDPVYVASCPECSAGKVRVVEGNLLDQDVDVIVNAWNRNIIPW
jgi:Zn finger protein HypA/HybF involved in hydrogenase expression